MKALKVGYGSRRYGKRHLKSSRLKQDRKLWSLGIIIDAIWIPVWIDSEGIRQTGASGGGTEFFDQIAVEKFLALLRWVEEQGADE